MCYNIGKNNLFQKKKMSLSISMDGVRVVDDISRVSDLCSVIFSRFPKLVVIGRYQTN